MYLKNVLTKHTQKTVSAAYSALHFFQSNGKIQRHYIAVTITVSFRHKYSYK